MAITFCLFIHQLVDIINNTDMNIYVQIFV